MRVDMFGSIYSKNSSFIGVGSCIPARSGIVLWSFPVPPRETSLFVVLMSERSLRDIAGIRTLCILKTQHVSGEAYTETWSISRIVEIYGVLIQFILTLLAASPHIYRRRTLCMCGTTSPWRTGDYASRAACAAWFSAVGVSVAFVPQFRGL